MKTLSESNLHHAKAIKVFCQSSLPVSQIQLLVVKLRHDILSEMLDGIPVLTEPANDPVKPAPAAKPPAPMTRQDRREMRQSIIVGCLIGAALAAAILKAAQVML